MAQKKDKPVVPAVNLTTGWLGEQFCLLLETEDVLVAAPLDMETRQALAAELLKGPSLDLGGGEVDKGGESLNEGVLQ